MKGLHRGLKKKHFGAIKQTIGLLWYLAKDQKKEYVQELIDAKLKILWHGQNQNDQDIPIETDKEVVVAEQQRVQPPSIDTMETLTGPQQSPVSPTVSRNYSFY